MKLSRFNGHNVGEFYIHTYRATVQVLWPVDGPKLKKYVGSKFQLDYDPDDEWGAKCIHLTKNDSEYHILCLRSWKKGSAYDASFLAHEAFHAVEHILSGRSIHLTPKSTEPHAYLIEEIVRRATMILNKKK